MWGWVGGEGSRGKALTVNILHSRKGFEKGRWGRDGYYVLKMKYSGREIKIII